MHYLYRFVGVRRLQFAREYLAAVLQAWSAEWRMDHESAPLAVSLTDAADTLADFACADADANPVHCLNDGHGAILLRGTAADWRACVFGRSAASLPADTVADTLLAQARQTLLNALAGHAANPAAAAAPDVLPTTAKAPADRLAWIRAHVQFDGAAPAFSILIDAQRFNAALAPQAAAALTRRSDAIGHATLALRLHFSLEPLNAAGLRALQPGTVLRSSHRLDQPLHMGSDERPEWLTAFLGQRNGNLAARISVNPIPAAAVHAPGNTRAGSRSGTTSQPTTLAAERAGS